MSMDKETEKALSPDKKTESKKTAEIPVEDLGIGDQLDFNQLFRVKGKQGLFVIGSTVNKSKMIRVASFLDFKTGTIVNVNKLICLNDYKFLTIRGEHLSLVDVFNNYQKYLDGGYKEGDKAEKIMSIMVPNYDPEYFKAYHVNTILKWYQEILTKMQLNEKKEETQTPQQ